MILAIVLALLVPATQPAEGQSAQPGETAVVFRVEAEALPGATLTGPWQVQADEAASGGLYLRWTGPNHYKQPPDQGLLRVAFSVPADGVYQLELRMNHAEATRADLENDLYVRMNDGPWLKLFHPGGQQKAGWTWHSQLDLHHVNGKRPPARYALAAGEHTLHLAGRSANFRFDQVRLVGTDKPATEPADLAGGH